jgi:AbrB family looped-hinge helix DNA binding protein
MNITSKGQVTIPIEIRKKLGLLPNTSVEFELKGNAVLLRKKSAQASKGAEKVARMQEAGRRHFNRKWTTEKIMALTRGDD